MKQPIDLEGIRERYLYADESMYESEVIESLNHLHPQYNTKERRMDIQEAISILDPETSRDALWKHKEGDERMNAVNIACRLACDALALMEKVVHCKDCREYYAYDDWDRNRRESVECHECRYLGKDFGPDGFCNYGTRADAEGK